MYNLILEFSASSLLLYFCPLQCSLEPFPVCHSFEICIVPQQNHLYINCFIREGRPEELSRVQVSRIHFDPRTLPGLPVAGCMKKKQNLFKTTGVTCEFMKLEKLEELKDFSEFAKISGFATIFARSGSPETKTLALLNIPLLILIPGYQSYLKKLCCCHGHIPTPISPRPNLSKISND